MKTKIDELRKKLKDSLMSTWRVSWVDGISLGDWSLMHNLRIEEFKHEQEAIEFIKDKGWKNKPFYYQPTIDEVFADKCMRISKQEILFLLDIIEKQHKKLEQNRNTFRYCAGPTRDVKTPILRTAEEENTKIIKETTEMLEGVEL